MTLRDILSAVINAKWVQYYRTIRLFVNFIRLAEYLTKTIFLIFIAIS